jgi:hypothetical protein
MLHLPFEKIIGGELEAAQDPADGENVHIGNGIAIGSHDALYTLDASFVADSDSRFVLGFLGPLKPADRCILSHCSHLLTDALIDIVHII